MDHVPVYCKTCGPVAECDGHVECRCDGQIKRNDRRSPAYFKPESIYPKNLVNSKGFSLCCFCGRVRDFGGKRIAGRYYTYLVVCPNCKQKFMGPRPYFPIDYECEKCE